MKAIYSTMLLSCALFIGCTNDELVSEGALTGGQEVKVIASIEGNDSRTSYTVENGIIKTAWNAGDAIGLCVDGGQSNLEYTAAGNGATTAFNKAKEELNAADGTTVYAYYPYMADKNGLTKDGNIREEFQGKEDVLVNIPMLMNQFYQADNTSGSGQWYAKGATPINSMDFIYASGTVQNSTLKLEKFNHIFAFIKLTIEAGALLGDATAISQNFDNVFDPTQFEGEYYKIKIKNEKITLYTYGGMLFNLKEKRFARELKNDYWNEITYFINKEDYDGTQPLTCYIAVLPGTANTALEIRTNNGKEVAVTQTVPAGGFKTGQVYPVTLKAPEVSNDPNGIEGYYNLSYTLSSGYEDELTVSLTKKDDTTYEWKKFNGRDDMTLLLTYSPKDETLTMNAGQKISDGSELYFMNSTSVLAQNQYFTGWIDSSPTHYANLDGATKDNTVTYVAKKSTVDGKTVFTFEDGGTWPDNTIQGFFVAKESSNASYDLECWYYGSCTIKPVLTKMN